jgi:hypothetical protein
VDPGAPSDVEEIHRFAVHVELELLDRGFADAHGFGALVTREPI